LKKRATARTNQIRTGPYITPSPRPRTEHLFYFIPLKKNIFCCCWGVEKKKKKGDSGSVLSGRVINNIAGSQVKKKVRKNKIKKSTKKKKNQSRKTRRNAEW
jgi:hypothetical protein